MFKKINTFIKSKYFYHLLIIGLLFIYILLAFKNPFADNSLISNLEPTPDTLLYSFPAWNWVRGNGWNLAVAEKEVRISVPNTYGYYLAPFMWVFGDIRAFYIANMLLTVGASILFMLAVRNFLGRDKWYLVAYSGFLLVTNFHFFNQPQLAMAENANYFLVCAFLYFMSISFRWKQLWLIVPFLILTLKLKNTNMLLMGAFSVSFIVKVIYEKVGFSNIKKWGGWVIVFALITLLLSWKRVTALNLRSFGLQYLEDNFKFYYSCLIGRECRNLWYWQKLVSWDMVAIFAVGVASFLRTVNKKRMQIVELLIPIVFFTLGMSLFVDTEGRHVEILVPIMMVVGAMGVDFLIRRFRYPLVVVMVLLVINLLATSYVAQGFEPKALSLKKQVGLNLRHREDPWNYMCVRMIQDYMKDKEDTYFGSFLSIYLFDAYGSEFEVLPLSNDQDFMNGRGLRDYFPPPLKDIYDRMLNEGKEIYVSDNYASNGRDAWRHQWDVIMADKKLEKVYQSPLDNCNIYRMTLNDEE